MGKFVTIASGAIWWPNLQSMPVAPSGGQIWNRCKWRHLVAKFSTIANDAIWYNIRCSCTLSRPSWQNLEAPLVFSLITLILHHHLRWDERPCNLVEEKYQPFLIHPVQCFAGYFDIEYGHLLDGEKQMGVIINTCKEFNLLPLNKGYFPIRATPPSRLGINP